MVEAETNSVSTFNDDARRERQGYFECRETPADSAIALARLRDGNCIVVQR